MVRNIPLDRDTKSNYLLTSLSPLSNLLSKCTVNTRHAWTWKSDINILQNVHCTILQRIVFAGTHCLANTHGDRLKLFHAWDNLPAWLRPSWTNSSSSHKNGAFPTTDNTMHKSRICISMPRTDRLLSMCCFVSPPWDPAPLLSEWFTNRAPG